MKKPSLLNVCIVISLLVIAIAGSSIITWRHTLNRLTVRTVTPTAIAAAMKNDDFYGTYNENTLLVKGEVASVTKQQGDTIVYLRTNSTYSAACDLGATSVSLQKGMPLTVLAEAATAERQPHGVLLINCVLPS